MFFIFLTWFVVFLSAGRASLGVNTVLAGFIDPLAAMFFSVKLHHVKLSIRAAAAVTGGHVAQKTLLFRIFPPEIPDICVIFSSFKPHSLFSHVCNCADKTQNVLRRNFGFGLMLKCHFDMNITCEQTFADLNQVVMQLVNWTTFPLKSTLEIFELIIRYKNFSFVKSTYNNW